MSKQKVTLETIKNAGFTEDQASKVMDIIVGRTEPEEYKHVRDWVNQCYNRPTVAEMQMAAIDEILEGYGIESFEHKGRIYTYVNMGDSYTATIVEHDNGVLRLASVADYVE